MNKPNFQITIFSSPPKTKNFVLLLKDKNEFKKANNNITHLERF